MQSREVTHRRLDEFIVIGTGASDDAGSLRAHSGARGCDVPSGKDGGGALGGQKRRRHDAAQEGRHTGEWQKDGCGRNG